MRSLIDGSVRDVHPFEHNFACNHLVLRVAHERHEQRSLPGPIGAKEDMGLSRLDFKIDVLQDDLSRKLHLQILDK